MKLWGKAGISSGGTGLEKGVWSGINFRVFSHIPLFKRNILSQSPLSGPKERELGSLWIHIVHLLKALGSLSGALLHGLSLFHIHMFFWALNWSWVFQWDANKKAVSITSKAVKGCFFNNTLWGLMVHITCTYNRMYSTQQLDRHTIKFQQWYRSRILNLFVKWL